MDGSIQVGDSVGCGPDAARRVHKQAGKHMKDSGTRYRC